MHEYALVEALLSRADLEARARGASAIHRVVVRVGELSGVELDLFRTAFETFREGTTCARAVLDVRTVEARWGCRLCGAAIPRGAALRCGHCGIPASLKEGADDLFLERLELELPDE